MYKNYAYLFLVSIIFLFSCEEEVTPLDPDAPIACFTTPKDGLFVGIGLTFNTECSSNAVSYLWDFGDESTSLEVQPTHVYKEEGNYTVTLVVTDSLDNSSSYSESISIGASPFIEHAGFIDEAEVWEQGYHLIKGNVTIRHGSLKIMPGAEIFVNEGKSLFVGHEETNTSGGALLTAEGTQDQPIVFKPSSGAETAGAWGHLYFTPTSSTDAKLSHCQFLYGGKTDWNNYPDFDYYNDHGLIELDHAQISMENCQVIGAANWGIYLTEDAQFVSFNNNTVRESVSYPLKIDVNSAHTIGTENIFDTDKGVLVTGQWFDQLGVSWKKLNVPYVFDFHVKIGGYTFETSLNLEPGVTLAFDDGYGLSVGGNASLRAEGTEADPIIFTSSATHKVPGSWSGLGVSGNSVVRNCIIEYAGSGGSVPGTYPAVTITASSPTVFSNNIIRDSGNDGVDFYGSEWNITFEENIIENCVGFGLSAWSPVVHLVPLSNQLLNTLGFYVSAQGIQGAVTWPVRPEPYILVGTLFIQSYEQSSLTLPAGTQLQMRTNATIEVGNDNFMTGTLIAEGTADKPILITLADIDKEAGKGNWGTLMFGKGATSSSKLTHCRIEYGGNYHLYTYWGMLHFSYTDEANAPMVTNNYITNSSSYGISTYYTNVSVSENTFENNAEGDMVDVTN